ncbi:hypothetical protein C4D60_Mb06t03320 [Musa balbisiana]|uniref:Uncharacterized protein n=1 Tax=Musa balbisiana TaxID=52838 RepID=A0A4S8IL05_MUSBA|nr:hypothetical protein C4D60_Mb06t03320 [Musa balbisiana]
MAITCCSICGPLPSVLTKALLLPRRPGGWSGSSVAAAPSGRLRKAPALLVRGSVVNSSESSSSFAKRMERAWLISQGSASCPDCKGTGFRAKWLEEPRPPSE